jgi:hypothetical protein
MGDQATEDWPVFLAWSYLNPEDGNNIFLRNVVRGKKQDCTVQHPKRLLFIFFYSLKSDIRPVR